MNRNVHKKLLLSRETVRRLDHTDLGRAYGGNPISAFLSGVVVSVIADGAKDALKAGLGAISEALADQQQQNQEDSQPGYNGVSHASSKM